MYCEPEVVEPPILTIKTDLSSLGRSTIRRHRTVRDSTHSRDRVLLDRHSRESDRRSSSNTRGYGHSYLDLSRRSNPVPVNVETGVNFARRAALTDLVYPVASRRVGFDQARRLRTDVAFLRDAVHHERPRRRLDGLDTVPELMASSHPASFGAGRRRARLRSDLRHPNATPYMRASTSEVLGHSDPHPGLDHSPVAPSLRRSPNASSPYPPLGPVPAGSLTSRFAPAYRSDLVEDISLREFLLRQGYGMNRDFSPDGLSSVVSGERRTPIVPWQENQETPRYSLEGIEDRRRSLSPGHYYRGALLDTMMPDDRLPSLAPSFTSISASASSFSSNPASNLGTIATAPSTNSLPHVYPTACESTDSEGSISSEDNEYNVQNSYTVNYRMQNPTNSAYLNSRGSRLPLNAAELARHSILSEPSQELLQIQNNLDTLERNVPLEW